MFSETRRMPQRLFVLLLVATMGSTSGCQAPSRSALERLTQARSYTQDHYMENGYRAEALADWFWLDQPEHRDALSVTDQRWVDFGIGFLSLMDMVIGGGTLIAGLTEDGGSGESIDLESKQILDILTALHKNVIHDLLAVRFQRVAEDKNFSVVLRCDEERFPDTQCPLQGEMDFGEFGLLAGVFLLADNLVADLENRENLLKFVADLALNLPKTDDRIDLFHQLPALAWRELQNYSMTEYNRGFSESTLWQLPFDYDLPAARQRYGAAVELIVQAFFFIVQESDNQDKDVLPREVYLYTIAERILGVDDQAVLTTLQIADLLTVPNLLYTEFQAILDSLRADSGETGQYYISPTLNDFYSILAGSVNLPADLPDMHFPGIWLGGLFGEQWRQPMAFLPESKTSAETFYADFEQERYTPATDSVFYRPGISFVDSGIGAVDSSGKTILPGRGDGIFQDRLGYRLGADFVGLPPLAHAVPGTDAIDGTNNWVDPLYLFWPDSTLGGVLISTRLDVEQIVPDPTVPYGNNRLNGLFSAVLSVIDSVTQ